MISPHYILLSEQTFDRIIDNTELDPDFLKESLKEATSNGVPYYVTTKRNRSGLLIALLYTEKQLVGDFGIEIDPRSATHFVKI